MNILNDIVRLTRQRVAAKKEALPLKALEEQALSVEKNRLPPFSFEQALRGADVAFICEIKKASPSLGNILPESSFSCADIAREYETADAKAISVLTEPFYFKGADQELREAASAVSLPVLRKDFVVDEYMIYEARLLGADAVLLIRSVLSEDQLAEYIRTAHRLGLSALVETRDEKEVETALRADARIIGVNNRDLKTFKTDTGVSERLRKRVPRDRLFVSESGMKTPADIQRLREAGVDAVLVGEALMRSADRKSQLEYLRGGAT